jgi:large subunit ribosomal protein L21
MIAVVEIGGKQYTVENGSTIVVDHQHIPVGQDLTLSALLLADAEWNDVRVGTPLVAGSKITFRVDEHFKAEKIRVFKIKSKKRYMRTNGFRAMQTRLTVTSIA